MVRLAGVAIAVLLAFGLASGARAEGPGRRVALVIAESGYPGRNFLPNPTLDAALMARSLKTAGFQTVVVKSDVGYGDFIAALRDFGQQARGAEVAFVYFSGHGIQSAGRNWLVPVDAALGDENDLNLQAINLDQILAAASGAKWQLVALDACRDTPFTHEWHSRSRAYQAVGLAPVEADNVVVMYATAENHQASDGPKGVSSPFATALARALTEPGVEIHRFGSRVREHVMAANPDQRPFFTDSIGDETFYFLGPVTVNVAPPAPPPAFDPRSIELALWTSVANSNDAAQLNAYLAQYPNGVFAAAARAKIAALQGGAAVRSPVRPATRGYGIGDFRLGMTPDEVNSRLGAGFRTVAWATLPVAGEYKQQEVRYFFHRFGDDPVLGKFIDADRCVSPDSYLTFLFVGGRLFRISFRFLKTPQCGDYAETLSRLARRVEGQTSAAGHTVTIQQTDWAYLEILDSTVTTPDLPS